MQPFKKTFLQPQTRKSKHTQPHLFLISGALQNKTLHLKSTDTWDIPCFLPPPPPPSPPLPQWAVLWCYDVRFLRQYHSTVHRETTAVQNYTGLPRTLHPAQVGHWRHLDFFSYLLCFSFFFFLKPPVIWFTLSKTVCWCQVFCSFLLLNHYWTFKSGSNKEGKKVWMQPKNVKISIKPH